MTSEIQAQEADELLSMVSEMTRCDRPASWILRDTGTAHFERCYGFAYALYQQGRYAQAKQLLLFLSLSNPIDFRVELSLGLCAKNLGELGEAVSRFGKAMLLNALDPRPIYFTAQIFESIEEWDQAWIFFDHAYKLALGNAAMAQILAHAKEGRAHCQAKQPSSPQTE